METVIQRSTEKEATFEFRVSKENFDFATWFEKPSEIRNDRLE
jgi:hypothetical protein